MFRLDDSQEVSEELVYNAADFIMAKDTAKLPKGKVNGIKSR